MEYTQEHSTRASQAIEAPLPAAIDQKDDHNTLKRQLAQRKKPIYAGLAFLCLVVIGVSVGVATSSGSSASNQSAKSPSTPDQVAQEGLKSLAPEDDATSEDSPYRLEDIEGTSSASGSAGSGFSESSSDAGSSVAEERSLPDSGSSSSNASTSVSLTPTTEPLPSLTLEPELPITVVPAVTPKPDTTTPTETPSPTSNEELLPYTEDSFNWLDKSNWEYASGRVPANDMFGPECIKLTSANSPEPIRTKKGWAGQKVVLVEWERSGSSDTNIWMLNTKLRGQFAAGNGWPHLGELDIFEMFNQDAIDKGHYDFSGFGPYSDVSSYGQFTLHMGAPFGEGPKCFCPASPFKDKWYKDQAPLVSGCAAQFANTGTNAIATVFGVDGNGQFLQFIQNPVVKKGGKDGERTTYDIMAGSGVTTPKIYNNAELFWGTPSSDPCAGPGGHNPNTGFPFFEEFRLVLEEQKKNDGGAWFKVTNVQVFRKN